MQISTRSYCYLLLWFGLIIICSELTPYFANDYRYMLVQGTHDFISSYQDIWQSQYQHYFAWGGRSVAHTIAQVLLFWGKPLSAVAQACCYVLLLLFIYYNAYGIKPTLRLRFMPLFVISALLFMQLRMYGEVVFNIVSSANYLYTTTLVLMFLLPYRISIARDLTLHWALLWPLMVVLGVLAGWSNENTAAAVATGLGLLLLYNLKQRRLKFWQCVGYAAFLVGFALLVFAPGNQARLDSMEDKGFDYVEHTFGAVWIFAESLLVSAILLLVLAYLYWKVREHFMQYARPRRYLSSIWFIGMGFFSLFLMIFAPNFPARAATPFTVFLIVGVIGLADIMLSRGYEIVSWRCQLVLSSAAALFMVLAMANIIYCGVVLSEDNKTRQAELVAQLDQGKTELVVSPMHIYTYKYVYVADVRASSNYWTNKIVSDFYQIKSIVRSCDYPSRTWLNDLVPFTLEWSDEDCALRRIDAQALESGPAATECQVQDQEQGQQNTDSAELTSEAHPVDGVVESDVAAGSASAAAEAETATITVTAE